MQRSVKWAERKFRPYHLLLKASLSALALLAVLSHAKEPTKPPAPTLTEGGYSGPHSQGPAIEISRWAEENCKVVFKAHMANERELTVLASPGFHLDGTAILNDCNRILAVLGDLSPWPFKRDLTLYYTHFEPNTGRYRWALPVGDSLGWIFVLDDKPKQDSYPTYGAEKDRTWAETSGECALSAEFAHELMHSVAPVFYINPHGVLHWQVGTGWFGEGLAEYACYLAWKDTTPCPWNQADPDFALKAFLSDSRRKHLWHWQSGIDNCWKPPKGTAPSEVWPSADHVSRSTFLSTDYTTAFGAFLYLEARAGCEKLKATCRQLVAKHTWQSGAFYQDLENELGFDIREVTDKDILDALDRRRPYGENKVAMNSE